MTYVKAEESFNPVPMQSDATLRDYFAAKAVQGMLACSLHTVSNSEAFAKDAYTIADAMLRAREAV